MALPLPPGLTPPEIAFLCEMELVTIIPRQRLERLELLGVSLNPPHRTDIPLWLALLLKRQRRANILPPPWLNTHSLAAILEHETEHELGEMLLEAASDDFEDPDHVRKLLRGLREVRMAKLRTGVDVLDAGAGFQMNGVGGMEVGEGRAFVTGVIDGLRKITASQEQQRKDRDREELENGYSGNAGDYDDDEMDMQ
ncbi:DNA replication complex GINS protein PSF2 [Phaeosphaeriaceae sp. PMI808]|nr:DNA replication complex GINS protein PSF2 [Phaeosphaeriaceae sp. PMI808]